MAFDTSPMDIGGDVVYELLSARRIRAEIFESRRTWSLRRFSSCSSGVMVVRGGLEARDFVSLGGVMLGSDPLMIELKSVPRMLLLFVEPESRGPGQVNAGLGPIVNVGSNGMATALILAAVLCPASRSWPLPRSSPFVRIPCSPKAGAETSFCVGRLYR